MTLGLLNATFRFALVLLSAVVIVSCGPRSTRNAASQPPPRTVVLAIAAMRPMERTITITGTLAAREQSILSAKVTGRLRLLAVDIGSVVNRGDVLAELEPRDYELEVQEASAALAQARASLGLEPNAREDSIQVPAISSVQESKALLDEATRNRERLRRLAQDGVAAQSELDTAETAYRVAAKRFDAAQEEARTRIATVAQRRAELELAQKRLSDTTLRAPFDGVVQARQAGLGEYVAAGSPVIELVKTDPLRLRLTVPEIFAAQVQTGQVVRLSVQGDETLYQGTLARLSPALDESTRMLLVEADVPQRGALRPGLFTRASIVLNPEEPGLSVPASAILTFAGIEKVVTVVTGKAAERVVVTGRRGSDWVEVISGLKPGDQVVLNPSGLRTGNPVVVASPSAPARTNSAPQLGS